MIKKLTLLTAIASTSVLAGECKFAKINFYDDNGYKIATPTNLLNSYFTVKIENKGGKYFVTDNTLCALYQLNPKVCESAKEAKAVRTSKGVQVSYSMPVSISSKIHREEATFANVSYILDHKGDKPVLGSVVYPNAPITGYLESCY